MYRVSMELSVSIREVSSFQRVFSVTYRFNEVGTSLLERCPHFRGCLVLCTELGRPY